MFLLSKNYWEVMQTKEKGEGVFAKKTIPAGIVLGDYRGRVLKTADALLPNDKENFYLMYYHDHASIFPDLSKPGIHLLNHSCSPNAWMYIYKGHTLFFSLRKIFKDEEITISYLLGPKELYCKNCTHNCICQSSICQKTMHLSIERYKQWSAFHKKQSKETKRLRITYNKILPALHDYPKIIPDNPMYTLFGSEKEKPLVLNNTSFPNISQIRKLIRTSGKTIALPKIKKEIRGVLEDHIISVNLIKNL